MGQIRCRRLGRYQYKVLFATATKPNSDGLEVQLYCFGFLSFLRGLTYMTDHGPLALYRHPIYSQLTTSNASVRESRKVDCTIIILMIITNIQTQSKSLSVILSNLTSRCQRKPAVEALITRLFNVIIHGTIHIDYRDGPSLFPVASSRLYDGV